MALSGATEFSSQEPAYFSGSTPDARTFEKTGLIIKDFAIDQDAIARSGEATRQISLTGKRRAQDLWRSAAVRAIACNAQILAFLHQLYGRRAMPFQTLNFVQGSEQKAHADTIHFSSEPAHFMCGVWVALEDVDAENGPLFYYPGSHKLPIYSLEDIGGTDYVADYEPFVARQLLERGYESETALLKKGDAVVWAANVFHGGAPILDAKRTRLSQVTHYYFEGCCHTTPLRECEKRAHIREIFDISENRFAAQVKNGRRVRPELKVALAARVRNMMKIAPVS